MLTFSGSNCEIYYHLIKTPTTIVTKDVVLTTLCIMQMYRVDINSIQLELFSYKILYTCYCMKLFKYLNYISRCSLIKYSRSVLYIFYQLIYFINQWLLLTVIVLYGFSLISILNEHHSPFVAMSVKTALKKNFSEEILCQYSLYRVQLEHKKLRRCKNLYLVISILYLSN